MGRRTLAVLAPPCTRKKSNLTRPPPPTGGSPSDLGESGGEGGIGGSGNGDGGSPGTILPRPVERLSVGRLPNPATACWLAQPGDTDATHWQQRKSLYQSIFMEWLADTSLVITWKDVCAPPLPDGTHEEDLRILLEDRLSSEYPPEVSGCDRAHVSATWAITPEDHEDFLECAWNMSLSASLRGKSVVLHTAGHALGIVHDHFGSTDVCPLDSPTDRSWSPYLSYIDDHSALLAGMSYDESDGAQAVCGLPSHWNDIELSQGDRLAMTMLYPPTSEHQLYPRGPALLFGGEWVFPEHTTISFTYDWLRSGASEAWFQEPQWRLQTSSKVVIGSSGLYGEYIVEPGQSVSATHSFVDPFGDEHTGQTKAQMSNSKHTAVLSTLL
jgi:hypothetical protein